MSFENEFIKFSKQVFPKADEEQVRDMRLIWYTSAWVLIQVIILIIGDNISKKQKEILGNIALTIQTTVESFTEERH